MNLAESVLAGERLALSRLLTLVEDNAPAGRSALNKLYPFTGKAHIIGVTGAPGTGKSSLVNQIALHYRKQDQPKKVAILAVDPSSPFTGGAVLGDRVRMRDLSGDTGVFIRSMASRGSLGGLANATASLSQVFDAAGFDIVLIETVGAGQAEVEIARLAHTTLVVEAPGMGDDIQAIKAGIMEIADILVINKADRPGVENTERALKSNLELAHPTQKTFLHHGQSLPMQMPEIAESSQSLWIPPIHRTIATDGSGLPELLEAISKHAEYLQESGERGKRERERAETEINNLIIETLLQDFWNKQDEQIYNKIMTALLAREISPGEAVEKLLKN